MGDLNINSAAAVGALQAFINAVEAQAGKAMFQSDANHLIGKAQQIIGHL